ncbi:DUF6917 domain-containing protein [Sporolituus thermophilus]|uniref:DUF6917 domain-containing protein n=1 Tax=Sporolituus thermophilus DSM 23256 TaxID=1123285 RepID=A0A1G7LZS6_9FIRM|nr:hypothetical protein [Sporolituus thermophilus]SDF54943.1 hypothetical protein SAMN05660235_01966 [Sporolituus thermophilus DSM 23256]
MAVVDPYKSGKLKNNPYAKKSDVGGSLVVVLDGQMDDRGLSLIAPISRCIKKDEVHELILTDEMGARPGVTVNSIAYLGFFAAEQSGVLVEGDEVTVNGKKIGKIAGFDETHMPNHLNIVIKAEKRQTGLELDLNPGDKVVFHLVRG